MCITRILSNLGRDDSMTIYIDSDYKCHTSPGEGLTAVERGR